MTRIATEIAATEAPLGSRPRGRRAIQVAMWRAANSTSRPETIASTASPRSPLEIWSASIVGDLPRGPCETRLAI